MTLFLTCLGVGEYQQVHLGFSHLILDNKIVKFIVIFPEGVVISISSRIGGAGEVVAIYFGINSTIFYEFQLGVVSALVR